MIFKVAPGPAEPANGQGSFFINLWMQALSALDRCCDTNCTVNDWQSCKRLASKSWCLVNKKRAIPGTHDYISFPQCLIQRDENPVPDSNMNDFAAEIRA